VRAFVSAFYVTEFGQRLALMSDELDLSLPQHEVSALPGANVVQALRDYQDAVMRESVLDPITTEMVRLRCARVHNCRICKTLRLDRAHSVGVDESMTSKVDFYEQSDLSPRIKRALRITDAFITRPDSLTDETAADAKEYLSPEQRASLLLSITKWSTQKIHVALGTDGADALPKNSDGVSFFDFDEDGRVAGYAAVPTDS
jgi:alkylhydroperoxidase family enzyme